MTEIVMYRTPTGSLAPADDVAREFVGQLKVGTPVRVKVARARSLAFHRKAFALFKLAFDTWDPAPGEYRGQPITKNFDRFRKDVTIMAGFYEPVFDAAGRARLVAESLSFSTMTEDRFQQVYRAVLGVVWNRILKGAGYRTEAEVERVVEELLRFE